MITLAPDDNIASQMNTSTQMIKLAPDDNNNVWDKMLSSGMQCYHLKLQMITLLSSGANVVIWDTMLSSGANVNS
jgi:hypothetical protein